MFAQVAKFRQIWSNCKSLDYFLSPPPPQVIIFNEKEFLSLNETERKEHCLSWKVTTNTVVQLSQLRKNPAYVLVIKPPNLFRNVPTC